MVRPARPEPHAGGVVEPEPAPIRLFMGNLQPLAPLEGWRHFTVTDRRAAVDYSHVLKDLADIRFAKAKTIVLVQDNLSTHSKGALYQAFPAAEARRLAQRFAWHYTPKHGRGGKKSIPHESRLDYNCACLLYATDGLGNCLIAGPISGTNVGA